MELDRCRDLRPQYPAYVVGTTDKNVELRIQQHLGDGCASCAGELEGLQEAFQAVPLATGPQPLLDGAAGLLARNIAGTPQAVQIEPIVYPETNERRLLITLLILFGFALGAAAFWGRAQLEELDDARTLVALERVRTRDAVAQYRQLEGRAQRIETMLDAVSDPRVSSHDLRPGAGGARARAFVDGDARSLALSVTELTGEAPFVVQWVAADDASTDLGALPDAAATRGGAVSFALPEGATLPARLRIVDAAGAVAIEGPLEPPP